MIKQFMLSLVLLVFMVSFFGCKSEDVSEFYVVSTTGMVHDIVLNVAGDLVKSNALMGPGVDPHLYKASAKDVKKLSKADLIFYNGLHLESNMIELFEQFGDKKPAVPISKGISKKKLLS